MSPCKELHTVDLEVFVAIKQSTLGTSNSEEAEVERFYEDLQDLLEHPKKMSFSL